MTNTPNTMEGFEVHVVEGESREALPLTKVAEFWIATVSTFGFLYEAIVTSVYSKHDTAKNISLERTTLPFSHFLNSFPGIEEFTQHSLFEEGDKWAYDLCDKTRQTMEGGLVIDNWVNI